MEDEVESVDLVPLPEQHRPVGQEHPLALLHQILEVLQGDVRDERPAAGFLMMGPPVWHVGAGGDLCNASALELPKGVRAARTVPRRR